MREACFCGRVEDLENREPVLDSDGEWSLRCSGCGHLDYLRWLPSDIRLLALAEADERHPDSAWHPGERRLAQSFGRGNSLLKSHLSLKNRLRPVAAPRRKERVA
jgi:hypothetical protein